MAERGRDLFPALGRRRLRRGALRSIVDLQAAINRHLADHSPAPAPFVWTADPDLILGKVARGSSVSVTALDRPVPPLYE